MTTKTTKATAPIKIDRDTWVAIGAEMLNGSFSNSKGCFIEPHSTAHKAYLAYKQDKKNFNPTDFI